MRLRPPISTRTYTLFPYTTLCRSGGVADRTGLPVDQLGIGSNSNDILTRWAASGSLVAEEVVPTLSPSMDIQVSSNHERLLFELTGRDGARTADLPTRFRGVGAVEAPQDVRFDAASVSPEERRVGTEGGGRCRSRRCT